MTKTKAKKRDLIHRLLELREADSSALSGRISKSSSEHSFQAPRSRERAQAHCICFVQAYVSKNRNNIGYR